MKTISAVFFLILTLPTLAQVSGFMGRRQAINFGASVSPAFRPVNVEKKGAKINQRFFVGYEFVVNKKWCISADYHSFTTAIDFLQFDNYLEELINGRNTFVYLLKGSGLSINASRFLTKKNDFIAPVGRYISFGVMTCSYTLIDTKGNVFTKNTKIGKGSVSGVVFSYGRKRVFLKRVLVNSAIESAFLFDLTPSKGNPNSESLIQSDKRLFYSNIFNFKLSVGYLF